MRLVPGFEEKEVVRVLVGGACMELGTKLDVEKT